MPVSGHLETHYNSHVFAAGMKYVPRKYHPLLSNCFAWKKLCMVTRPFLDSEGTDHQSVLVNWKSSYLEEMFYISMAGNWTSWPETGQLTSFAKNVIISIILEEGGQPLNILRVGK